MAKWGTTQPGRCATLRKAFFAVLPRTKPIITTMVAQRSYQIKTWTRNYRAQDATVVEAAPNDGFEWRPERMEELRDYLV